MGRVILALGVTAALALSAAAQLRPPKSTLRAIAVVELFRDAKGNLGSRLVPVTIMVEDKFYDAGLYKATPQPFVLEPFGQRHQHAIAQAELTLQRLKGRRVAVGRLAQEMLEGVLRTFTRESGAIRSHLCGNAVLR